MRTSSLDLLRKKSRQPLAQASSAPPTQHTPAHTAIQRAQQQPQSLASHEVMQLQSSMGNRAVSHLMHASTQGAPSLQTKLEVGPAHDKYEAEADQIASHVTRGESRQSTTGDQGGPAPVQVEQDIRRARGGGSSLPEGVRRSMEGNMGADFSGVRVHTDARADTLNRSLSARAFTTGQDVFFKQGEYRPGSTAGQSLLAHELIHVVQQTGGQQTAQRSPRIQRFTEQDTQRGAQTDWAGLTQSVTKPGEGMVSSVFIMHGRNGQKLIVKVEGQIDPENARPTYSNQSQFSDTVLRELGFTVPDSRIVRSGDTEFQQIINVISQRLVTRREGEQQDQVGAPPELVNKLTSARYFKVMASAKGQSFGSLMKEVQTKEQADQLFARMSANKFAMIRSMGKMAAVDALIGNDDRMMLGTEVSTKLNAGNIFVDDNGGLSLIDNESTLGDTTTTGTGENTGAFRTPGNDLINPLFDQIDQFLETLVYGEVARRIHKNQTGNNGGFNLQEYVTKWFRDNKEALNAAFKAGRDEGIHESGVLMQDKGRMSSLKTEALSYNESGDPGQQMWSTFKARGRYIGARSGGMSKEHALTESYLYQREKYGVGTTQLDPLPEDVEGFKAPKRKGLSVFKSSKKARNAKTQSRSLMEDDNTLHRIERITRGVRFTPVWYRNTYNSMSNPLDEQLQKAKGNAHSRAEIKFLKQCVSLALRIQMKDNEIYQYVKDVDDVNIYLDNYGDVQSKEQRLGIVRLQHYAQPTFMSNLRAQNNTLMQHARTAQTHLQESSPKFGKTILKFANNVQMTTQELFVKLRSSPYIQQQQQGNEQQGQVGPQLGNPNE